MRVVAGLLVAGLLIGCQPVDDVPEGTLSTPTTADAEARLGAPERGVPTEVPAAIDEHRSTAAEWQDGARPVEVVVDLDDGRWSGVSVLYLAPDADRMLRVRASSDGTTQERPTLEGLGLQPIPEAALAQVPELPDGLLEPLPLVEASETARDRCDVDDDVTTVIYATGAPAAWDGSRWTEPPRWVATLQDGDAAVVVDPTSGEAAATGCLEGG